VEDGFELPASKPSLLSAWTQVGSRLISEEDTRALLPEGVDFLTAKIGHVQYGGATGSVCEILVFTIFSDGTGLELRFRGEKRPRMCGIPAVSTSIS